MDVRSIFAAKGLRCTKQRVAIYEALRAARTHPTAEELYDRVRNATMRSVSAFTSPCPSGDLSDSGASSASALPSEDASGETLSLATVYNTLEALCEAGLCRKLPSVAGSARYDGEVTPHFHLVNEATGEFIDLPHDLGGQFLDRIPADLLAAIESRMGVKIDRLSMDLFVRAADPAVVSPSV